MKLTKKQVELIADIDGMYTRNSDTNKRLRLLGAAMVTIHEKPYDGYLNPKQEHDLKYAKDAISVAGMILMNQLPPLDDKLLDKDTSYEAKVSSVLDSTSRTLYREVKLVEETVAHNLLIEFLAEISAFAHIAAVTVDPQF